MFLVACNAHYFEIRSIVVTAFSILGRCDEIQNDKKPETEQKILDMAIKALF